MGGWVGVLQYDKKVTSSSAKSLSVRKALEHHPDQSARPVWVNPQPEKERVARLKDKVR